MERLTEKHYLAEDHYMKCSGNCHMDINCIDCPAFDRLVERLAAYEDTRLTPEKVAEYKKFEDEVVASGKTFAQLVELLEADKEGRVVVLPCKVYETDGVLVYEHAVREIIYRTAGGPDFDESTIGKSIFLTREEAERAMQEMEELRK